MQRFWKLVKGGNKLSIDIGGYNFSTPVKFADWLPPYRAGVYAILMYNAKVNKYYVIYIGQSSNLSDRGFFKSHHSYYCWIRQAGNDESKLHISVLELPNSTEDDRGKIEIQLINKFNPTCNKEF
jgi:hypothetical protein